MVKNLPADAGDEGRAPGEGNGNPLQYEIPWTEEPSRLQSMGSQRVGHNLATKTTTQSMLQSYLRQWGNGTG